MKKYFNLLAFMIVPFALSQNSQRIFQKYDIKDHILHIKVSDGDYQIKFLSPDIVETNFVPRGGEKSSPSHAVVLENSEFETEAHVQNNELYFGGSNLKVKVKFSPFQLIYLKNSKELISEKRGYYNSEHQPLEMVKDNIIAENTKKIEFNISEDEILYGGGARALGMNRRGYKLPLFNRAHYGYEDHSELMNYTMPVVVSDKQYLIHFDNSSNGYLDLDSNKTNSLTFEAVSGNIKYQIVVGDNWEDLIYNYTSMTGRQPMLPRWALGNFASRFGYHSQKEVQETIQKFRDERIPVDAVILDLYWFGKEIQGTMGNLEFDLDSFPQPKKMIRDLRNNNVETVLITEPFVLTTSKKWKDAVSNDILAKNKSGEPYTYDFYFGNTGIIDIYSEKGNKWFSNIYTDLMNLGVRGMWGDLGEPEVHPFDIVHAKGSGQEVHNIYGHDWAKLVQQSFHKFDSKLRPFILMRAGYSGTQRYGIVPWSGDVNRTWGGLQKQTEISLQMGLQGVAWMHSDLGGFAGDNLDDELYERWLQYGVFQPIFRPHAQEEVPSEPIYRSLSTKNVAREAIELRYKLLPYNYNLMFENHTKGQPLMRPIFFEEPDNKNLYTYDDTYLWGNDFLIAPVKQAKQSEIDVYLPSTSDWIDFYTGNYYEGGANYSINLNRNNIPVFVRAGAIIPMAKLMQSTKEYNAQHLEFHAYLPKNMKLNNTKIYNDDGYSRKAYENDNYESMEVTSNTSKNSLNIKLKDEVGSNYESDNKKIEFYLHNLTKTPKSVEIGNNKYPINWKSKSKTLQLNFEWNTSKIKELKIKF